MAETNAERLAKLEVEMKQVMANQDKFEIVCTDINSKLDSLLTLRNEGVGAFWLASLLMGTGVVGFFYALMDYFKNG